LLHEYCGVTTIAFKDGTVYMQGDKVSTGTKCCCSPLPPACTTVAASSGGAGTTVNTHEFPSAEHCIWFSSEAFEVPDAFMVKTGGETVIVFESGSGARAKCFQKPEGVTDVEVTVVGEDGTA
jgi:hypothetical protein